MERKFWLWRVDEDKWGDFYQWGLMGIGWKDLGDLKNYKDKKSIEKQLNLLYPSKTLKRQNDRLANWQFCNQIKIGDIIITAKNHKEFLGYGEVIGDYFFNEKQDETFGSFRKIKWIKKGKWKWNHGDGNGWAKKLLTDISPYEESLGFLLQDIGFSEEDSKAQDPNPQVTYPLNQILYGPPGTGKTYNTINKALEIIQEDQTLEETKKSEIKHILKKFEENPSDEEVRSKAKSLFDTFIAKGQIAFVTFHQSYSYEEFVEGIKPDDNAEEIRYKVKSGIFKDIARKAEQNYLNSLKTEATLQEEKSIKSKIDAFLGSLIEEEIRIKKTNKGDFGIENYDDEKIYIDTKDTKKEIELKMKDFEKLLQSEEEFSTSREMVRKVFGLKNQQQRHTYLFNLCKKFKEVEKDLEIEITPPDFEDSKLKPYILIIDEINRGNISKIFGELITLIEESKRIGSDEELKVKLPYSQDDFGVPCNLFVIGTMNTADRSITNIDTALRRRFKFIEMMPNANILSENIEGINLQKMLQAINERIAYLYDREKTIGHAFFIGITTLQELKETFQTKIIPLLQEYFYNDYEMIEAVLNGNGMIQKERQKPKGKKFAKFIEDRGLEEQPIYTIAPKDEKLWDEKVTYQQIYDDISSVENDQEEIEDIE